jgi:hypothetical protein
MIRYDMPDIHGFEMVAGYFPQHSSVAIHERNIVGATTGQYDAKILGRGAFTQNASTIEMPL